LRSIQNIEIRNLKLVLRDLVLFLKMF